MSVRAVRLSAGTMTLVAAGILWVLTGVVSPVPVGAWACCQDCEAKEAACYASCNALTHDAYSEDSLQACTDACDAELWHPTRGCWTHCAYCSQPPSPANCYEFVAWHEEECVAWYENGDCLWWQATGVHGLYSFQTNSGFCTS